MHWYSVYDTIYNIVHSVNEMFRWILRLLTDNTIFEHFINTVTGETIFSTIRGTAITLCVLFFFIEFLQKSMHLQWVTWENILMFVLKIVLAKIIVSNSNVILSTIQNGFAAMIPQQTISEGLLPENTFASGKTAKEMREEAENQFGINYAAGEYNDEIIALAAKNNISLSENKLLDDISCLLIACVSNEDFGNWLEQKISAIMSGSSSGSDMIGFFVPPTSEEYSKIMSCKKRDNWFDFSPLLCNLKIIIIGLIIQIIVIISCIIVLARVFELVVYSVLAPIPLATLSCEGLQDVGKGFLKSFVAVCIQGVVIVVMFIVFKEFLSPDSPIKLPAEVQSWGALLYSFVFGAGIMQSGAWAKRIVGSM